MSRQNDLRSKNEELGASELSDSSHCVFLPPHMQPKLAIGLHSIHISFQSYRKLIFVNNQNVKIHSIFF